MIAMTNHSGYVVFTESSADHAKVHIISRFSDYFDAVRCAKSVRGVVAYADLFDARFTATSPNGMNGIRR